VVLTRAPAMPLSAVSTRAVARLVAAGKIRPEPIPCWPSLKMSTAASFPVSMQNRAYRAPDGWLVFMLSAACSCCRGVPSPRRPWRSPGAVRPVLAGDAGMRMPGNGENDQPPGAGMRAWPRPSAPRSGQVESGP
jgi:hypothetical protein